MHSINEMKMTAVPFYSPNMRVLEFEQYEGDDFTLSNLVQTKMPFDLTAISG